MEGILRAEGVAFLVHGDSKLGFFPRAESWAWFHPLCDGRAIRSAPILSKEQKMSLVSMGKPVLEAATAFALYVAGVNCV